MTQCYSPLYCAKCEFTNSIPSLSWDLSLGEIAEMLHSYVLFMTKYAFLTLPLSESGIVIAFFLVGSGKSSGSLTPSTLADVFRCYVLCGLSELIFYSRPSGIRWNLLISLPSFNLIFFQTGEKWCESVQCDSVEMSLG